MGEIPEESAEDLIADVLSLLCRQAELPSTSMSISAGPLEIYDKHEDELGEMIDEYSTGGKETNQSLEERFELDGEELASAAQMYKGAKQPTGGRSSKVEYWKERILDQSNEDVQGVDDVPKEGHEMAIKSRPTRRKLEQELEEFAEHGA